MLRAWLGVMDQLWSTERPEDCRLDYHESQYMEVPSRCVAECCCSVAAPSFIMKVSTWRWPADVLQNVAAVLLPQAPIFPTPKAPIFPTSRGSIKLEAHAQQSQESTAMHMNAASASTFNQNNACCNAQLTHNGWCT